MAVDKDYSYGDAAAAGYEKAFAHVTSHFVPTLLRAGRVSAGQHVLDVACGTGLASAMAADVVCPNGHVTAADVSVDMCVQARARLAHRHNVVVDVEDGQSLTYRESTFDAVVCSLGLMFFPDPRRGVSEFYRVLRAGGHAAVLVLTTPERSYNGRINVILARHLPALLESTKRTFSLGDASTLETLFADAGFAEFETSVEEYAFQLPSFDAYYSPFESGAASTGEALARLSESARQAVREEVRRSLGDSGGPVTIPVEFRIASGRKRH